MGIADPPQATDPFPSTQWSLVGRAAGDREPECRRAALAELLQRYLPSLRRAVAQMGVRSDHAEDVLQSFICDRIIQQNILSAADSTRGRFRSFIFVSLRNFIFNDARARSAAKRSAKGLARLDGECPIDPPADDGARDAFEEAWIREVLAQTLARVRRQCDASGDAGGRVWQVFEWRVLIPARSGDPPVPYGVIAARLVDTTPMQAANFLVTAKRMFARELRGVVAEYTRDGDELEEEIRCLKLLAT